MSGIDPGLVGIWIVPGSAFTYEVDAAGGYHIGGPDLALTFSGGGAVMGWGPEVLDRQDGAGETPVGRWRERGTGADWTFAADGTYRVLWDGVCDLGIWALRDGGATLWTRELRAQLVTRGGEVTFDARNGTTETYGYSVGGGVWVLFDPVTRAEVLRYRDPATLPGA